MIEELCASVCKLVDGLTAAQHQESEEAPNQPARVSPSDRLSDEAWDHVCEFTARLADTPARSYEDVVGKIDVWRRLAHDSDDDFECIDETLLRSILCDVERLSQDGAPARDGAKKLTRLRTKLAPGRAKKPGRH